eukprot:maker-scaffold_7-snap-gene-12.43-mRNA-1 protein AED:0.26 eAED:0.26 QI:113/1/1/1/1/1/2/153/219
MKFGKKILGASQASPASFCTPEEWMDYKKLKKMLKNCVTDRSSADEEVQPERKVSEMKSSEGEKQFFSSLLAELKKVAAVYSRLESSALVDFLPLAADLADFRTNKKQVSDLKTETEKLLERCTSLHLRLVLIENYAVLNYCGFQKVLKKHDRYTGFNTKHKYMTKMVNSQNFAQQTKVRKGIKYLTDEFEQLHQFIPDNKDNERKRKNDCTCKVGLEN